MTNNKIKSYKTKIKSLIHLKKKTKKINFAPTLKKIISNHTSGVENKDSQSGLIIERKPRMNALV